MGRVRCHTAGAVEDSAKAMNALVAVFPLMLIVTLTIIMLQVRSFTTMLMAFATAPPGLVGAVPTLLVVHQPFGFDAILGLIALSGILMRHTLILVDQMHHDRATGLSDYGAIVELTVRRARPVSLTAVAILAFISLTHSLPWGALAYALIDRVGIGTLLTLLFHPALYAFEFRVGRSPRPTRAAVAGAPAGHTP
ncbi:AcrB/AcrD/AcrF family protein [Methylobacterium phyllostachyos]|uniref:AcrB/AcrD/AcrF family protein n=1 Tax=Methylobacterium phyllostachyos TaxID=582672 RepID=A0A1G9SAF8_9HYPH|nr:AcrB/AcrD/AcrF family protein [Methylobacterium phyllostachyos]